MSRETIAFPNTSLLSLASSFYNSFKKGESEKTRKRRREEGEKEGGGREGGGNMAKSYIFKNDYVIWNENATLLTTSISIAFGGKIF